MFVSNPKPITFAAALFCATHAAQADQVINDDLIIQGSVCAGDDCNNGLAFGEDTVRLKGSVLRIGFQDTTASARPSGDWAIVVNDAQLGGSDYFAVEDRTNNNIPFRIEEGAGHHAAYLDSRGNFGLGTNHPTTDVHILSSNTPTVRLQQDDGAGFKPYTWDIAGNDGGFFIRDTSGQGRLPFRVLPGAPTNALVVDGRGEVGLGTNTPSSPLHIKTNSSRPIFVDGGGHTNVMIQSSDERPAMITLSSKAEVRRVQALSGSRVASMMTLRDLEIQFTGTDPDQPYAIINEKGITTEALFTTGGGTCDPGPCDGVFDPAVFTVPSVEEHAAFMWKNGFLRGVGPVSPNQPINIGKVTTGVLHELEVAHIYIEKLHNQIAGQDAEIANLRAGFDELRTELDKLTGAVD